MLADKHWAQMQETPLEFTIARENYDDTLSATVLENAPLRELLEQHRIEVNPKDSIGFRVGVVNREGTDLILKFKDHMPELAELMPFRDRYSQQVSKNAELKQTMVDVDLMALTGSFAACRPAIVTAENLPNNDKLSIKTGGGRRNVYHRQVRQTTDHERNRKVLEKLVAPELHRYFDVEADHLFVVGHENGHSLGPDSSFQSALGNYSHTIEEHKADVISMTFMPEYVKAGVIDEETLRKIYTTFVVYRLFQNARPNMCLEHRVAELIHFNYLHEKKAFYFDSEGKLHIDFDTFHGAHQSLLEDTIEVQLSKSPAAAKEFIERWSYWGEDSQRIAAFKQSLGIRPYKRIKSYF